MSFLFQDEDEDDQQATLAVALAFIDSCGESSSPSASAATTTLSSSPSSCSESRSTDEDANQDEHEREADKRASLRVVIRTTANKKLTAAAATTATTTEPSKQKQVEPQTKAVQVAPVAGPGVVAAHDRVPRNGSAVTRHRARKRAEFASLRTELVELESTLTRLRRAKSMKDGALSKLAARASRSNQNPSSGDNSDATALRQRGPEADTNGSIWMEIAALQAKERFKSEELNQKLKDAVEKQKKTSKALEAILGIKGKTSAPMQCGLDLLSDIQKQGLYSDSMLSMESMVLAGLQASVARMYQSMNTIFDDATTTAAATSGLDVVAQSTQVKKDPENGEQFVELRTTTALPFGFLEAAHLIWRVFAMMRSQSYPGYSMQKRDITDSSFEKSYTLMLENPSGSAVELRGLSYVQRFVEERHVAYVFASVVTTPNGLAFRERGWVALFRSSKESPLFPVVMQSCQQISNEPCTATSSSYKPPTVNSSGAKNEGVLREFILAALVSRTRYQYQTIQNFMLESAGCLLAKRDPILSLQALKC